MIRPVSKIRPSIVAQLEAAEIVTPAPPQPLLREIAPGVPYPVEALGLLRPAVETVQQITQAPVAIPAQSAIGVVALAVQGFANVETLGGDRPVSVFALTIAASGERKSSCDALLMRAMREYEREQSLVVAELRRAWAIDHAIWKTRFDATLAKVKKGTAHGGDLAALGPEPAAPPTADRIVSEPTYEGLTKLFANGQPALGLFSDEGGQFLGGFAMSSDHRQKTLSAFNDLWMGNPIKRTRQGDGAITMYGRRLSLHLMVQPLIARALLSDPLASDTGFLARCLICEPASTIGTRLHATAVGQTGPLTAFESRLRDILSTPLPMDADTRELRPSRLSLSPEARAALIEWSDLVERNQAPGGDYDAITSYASKSAEQAARLAGVLTLWDDLNATAVREATMRAAITLAQFYLREAQRLANASTVSAAVAKAETLRKWLLSSSWGHSWITIRDVVRLGPNSLRESPEAKKAVQMLVEHRWLMPIPSGTEIGGVARREAWRIVQE